MMQIATRRRSDWDGLGDVQCIGTVEIDFPADLAQRPPPQGNRRQKIQAARSARAPRRESGEARERGGARRRFCILCILRIPCRPNPNIGPGGLGLEPAGSMQVCAVRRSSRLSQHCLPRGQRALHTLRASHTSSPRIPVLAVEPSRGWVRACGGYAKYAKCVGQAAFPSTVCLGSVLRIPRRPPPGICRRALPGAGSEPAGRVCKVCKVCKVRWSSRLSPAPSA